MALTSFLDTLARALKALCASLFLILNSELETLTDIDTSSPPALCPPRSTTVLYLSQFHQLTIIRHVFCREPVLLKFVPVWTKALPAVGLH